MEESVINFNSRILVVSVPNGRTKILTEDPDRVSLRIIRSTSGPIFVGLNSNVSASTPLGHPLTQGDFIRTFRDDLTLVRSEVWTFNTGILTSVYIEEVSNVLGRRENRDAGREWNKASRREWIERLSRFRINRQNIINSRSTLSGNNNI